MADWSPTIPPLPPISASSFDRPNIWPLVVYDILLGGVHIVGGLGALAEALGFGHGWGWAWFDLMEGALGSVAVIFAMILCGILAFGAVRLVALRYPWSAIVVFWFHVAIAVMCAAMTVYLIVTSPLARAHLGAGLLFAAGFWSLGAYLAWRLNRALKTPPVAATAEVAESKGPRYPDTPDFQVSPNWDEVHRR